MTQFHTRNVIRNAWSLFRNRQHALSRDIEQLRLFVDKAQNQPRTGNPVDLRAFARDPFHGPSRR